jgi:hypothetical protein
LKTQYVIIDWASNYLQYTGKFNFYAYGANKGVPMLFKDFESAWGWIYENIQDEEMYQDLFVEEI